jgi:hypothetical protein
MGVCVQIYFTPADSMEVGRNFTGSSADWNFPLDDLMSDTMKASDNLVLFDTVALQTLDDVGAAAAVPAAAVAPAAVAVVAAVPAIAAAVAASSSLLNSLGPSGSSGSAGDDTEMRSDLIAAVPAIAAPGASSRLSFESDAAAWAAVGSPSPHGGDGVGFEDDTVLLATFSIGTGPRRRRNVRTNKVYLSNGRVVRLCPDCAKYIGYKNYCHHRHAVHHE